MNKTEDLILNWLNNEIKLKPPVRFISKEFANGYRFGEILYNIKEITENQFHEFSNKNNTYAIRDNFILVKKYFKDLYELEIRHEEFAEIINKDLCKAVIVLYRLKNSISKKSINFLDIKMSLNPKSPEEINRKVIELIDQEFYIEMLQKDLLYDIEINKTENNKFLFSSTIKTFKSSLLPSKLNSTNFSFQNKYSTSNTIDEEPEIKSKIKLININKSKEEKESNFLLFNKNQINKIKSSNLDLKSEISQFKLPTIKNTYKSAEILSPNKSSSLSKGFYSPPVNLSNNIFITSENIKKPLYNTKMIFGNGKSNVAKENKFKITELTETLYKYGISDFHSNFKHTSPIFNISNSKELNKVREELKLKIRKKVESTKKQENVKKKLRIRLYDVPEIDFVHKEKNPLYEYKLPIGISMQKHNKYLTFPKRLKYSKEWKLYYNQRQIEKKIKHFASIIKKETKKFEKTENYSFNKEIFLTMINNNYNLENFNEYLTKKKEILKNDIPLIRNLILLIVDMSMEIFFYKEENFENEFVDVETFARLLELFIQNKPMRERVVDAEARLIKEKNNDSDDINPDKLKLNEEELNLKEDYKNFIGMWNDDKIMNKEYKGMKLEYTDFNLIFPKDYEPTESDLDVLAFPIYNPENYSYGDIILDCLDNKYIDKNKNNNINKTGKWDYINYKISLIGLPFCGKKYVASEICKVYPNLKMYSLHQLLRNYCEQYKSITEPIEKNPKSKSLKSNQIEQLKQEKNNKLKEFQPILQIIQPYINLIDHDNEKQVKKDKVKDKKKDKKIEKKNDKNITDNSDNSNNINNINNIVIPSDEVLLNILIYNIEKDFPKLSEEEIKNEIINRHKNISNLMKQKGDLEKQIQESKKPNPKDEQNLNNIKKEIQNIKNNTVKGFILVDFPTKINQCNLLEYYLNGYVDETQKPKTLKMINAKAVESLIDFNFTPNENNKLKKAGIDFIVNIIMNEENVNEKFNKKKYDPVNDKIYSEYELNQDVAIKDKKVMERLVENVPYYTKKHFDYYKKEYIDNISKINLFYNMFGFTKNNNDIDSKLNMSNNDNKDIDINKTYQEINTEESMKKDIKKERGSIVMDSNVVKDEKKEKTEKSEKSEKKAKNTSSTKEAKDNKDNGAMIKKEDEIKNKIMNFITDKIIGYLYKAKSEEEKKILYANNLELNDNEEEKDKIKFEPEFQINEIRGQPLRKLNSNKEKIIMKHLIDNFDSVFSDLKSFNIKYEKHAGKFIYLIKKQKYNIHRRLNLIQRKYRDFLNQTSDKTIIVHTYCTKYNNFFTEYPNAFYSDGAIKEFSRNINELNNALWYLINIKETVSIKELQEIKNSNFIEFELQKFYNNIKQIFLLETEKFLTMINSIYNLYHKKNDESTNTIISLIKNNNDKEAERQKKIINSINNKEYILKDLIEITNLVTFEDYEEEDEDDDDNDKNNFIKSTKGIKNNNIFYKKRNEPNSIDYIIHKNTETMFNNCIYLILAQEERINNLLKTIKESTTIQTRKTLRFKKRVSEISHNLSNTISQMKENSCNNNISLDESVRRMFNKEKNKYKYRICYLKSFVLKYIVIIIQTSIKIFHNIDKWIIKSVSLQSEAQNKIIQKLRSILNEKRLINEKKDVEPIELDTFEPVLTQTNQTINSNNYDDIIAADNDTNIYNKLNIDYLVNDDFINIKLKEDKDFIIDDNDENKNRYDIKKYKIILPSETTLYINNKKINKLNYDITQPDFCYDVDKFYELYTKLKKFEIKKDIISEQILFEVFIKKYLFRKDVFETENNKEINGNPINNTVEDAKEKENEKENNNNTPKKYPFICRALRVLNYKYVKKLLSFFKITIEHKSSEESNSDKEKEKEKSINDSNNININIEKEMNKEEYDNYLNMSELFTLLSLIGCQALTSEKEKIIMEEFNNKILDDTFISKNDFYNYNFWFEEDFDYLSCIKQMPVKRITSIDVRVGPRKKMERRKTKQATGSFLCPEKKTIRNSCIVNITNSIKDLLFNIWKDDKGNNFNIKHFLNALRISKYKYNSEESYKGDKYYEIIFGE